METAMKKAIVSGAWLIVLAVWIGIATYRVVGDPGIKEWTIAVTAGALTAEVAFWVTAGVLGITLLQSRKAVLAFLTRPFRRNK